LGFTFVIAPQPKRIKIDKNQVNIRADGKRQTHERLRGPQPRRGYGPAYRPYDTPRNLWN